MTDGTLDISLRYVGLDHVDLRGSSLNKSRFYFSWFNNCDLRGVDLRNSLGNPLGFFGSDLIGADLRSADLKNAQLLPAKANGVLYTGAILKSAKYNASPSANFTTRKSGFLSMI